MHVRTDLHSGENATLTIKSPLEALNSAMNMLQSANGVVQNALVDPNALKLFMGFIPPADVPPTL